MSTVKLKFNEGYKPGDCVAVTITKPTWKSVGYNPFRYLKLFWNYRKNGHLSGKYVALSNPVVLNNKQIIQLKEVTQTSLTNEQV